jgi:hypothetical protein
MTSETGKPPSDARREAPGGSARCATRIGRHGLCDLPRGHRPISPAMGWRHAQALT